MASPGFARLIDLEPGMWFSNRIDRTPFEFVGIESTRRPDRVRVRTAQGVTWIADRTDRVPLVTWRERP